mgnify:CR=1 FL=1
MPEPSFAATLAQRAVQLLYLGALAAWLGSVVGMGALALPAVFRRVPDRATAAEVAGALLLRLTLLKLALIPVLAAAAVLRLALWDPLVWWVVVRYALLFLMTQVALAGVVVLAPALRWVQEQAGRPVAALPRADPLRRRFGRLHRWATGLLALEVALGLAVLFFD